MPSSYPLFGIMEGAKLKDSVREVCWGKSLVESWRNPVKMTLRYFGAPWRKLLVESWGIVMEESFGKSWGNP